MCRQAAAPALVFFKRCVAANLSDQFPNMRRESEVMVRSWENLTCLGRPRHPGHFFPKRIGWQMFSAKSPTQDGKVRALTVACENSISQAEGRIRLSFFQKWVWRQKKSAKLGTRHGKVRYLPETNKIEDVQTSCGAGAVFFQNVCGSKSFRSVAEHETGK